MKKLKVLIIDDQHVFAEGLKFIIESRTSDIEVLDIGVNGREAIRLVRQYMPDVVLMDVRMPEMDGVQATLEISKSYPKTKILMLTTFDDDLYVKQAIANGALGYLLKSHKAEEIINSIYAVNDGIVQIDSVVAPHLLSDSTKRVDESLFEESELNNIRQNLNYLSPREKEVLLLIVQAFDNRQMANRLAVSEQTIRNYVSHIYSKLGSKNRMAIIRAIERMELSK